METIDLEGGFAEPVLDAQRGFRAMMNALANPGAIQKLDPMPVPPAPLTAELALVALTLCDHDSPLWLDEQLIGSTAVSAWLRFHTGAPLVSEPIAADFALVAAASNLLPLNRFALGTDQYPDRSTTIAMALPSLLGGTVLTLRGPGIKDEATIAPVGLPGDFLAQWLENSELFPRGIDLLLVADGEVIGLPRTTRISLEAQ
jgi:alpha-D-ribose 1-methylphosphonate 5-triphosphate synthase subunit PhnH